MTTAVLTPVARLLQGSLYTGATTNMEGKPLVTKSGEARTEWYFGIGIRKNGETHWNQTEWGAQIWKVGCEAFKNAATLPSFAWKIIDGDSTIPNKNGVKPCDKDGWSGHWILNLSCGFAPKVYNRDGSEPMPQIDAILPGDFIQVLINVAGNNSSQSPGVYLNHSMVAFQAYGQRITVAVDPRSVGFGNASLPPDASLTPIGGMSVQSPASQPPVTQPHTAILNPPLPPVVADRVMTDKATKIPYQQWIEAGWSDDKLIAEGYMNP